MEALRIGTMESRYHLPPEWSAARSRLDALAGSQLADAIAGALESAGVRPSEEICIREVRVPVVVDLERPDVEQGRDWAAAIVSGVQAELAASRPRGLVRYPSRAAAWADCAVAIAGGDLERLWAWRQLDLASADRTVGPDRAAAALRDGLLREPEMIVGTLGVVAGAGRLPGLLALWNGEAPLELARAAFACYGGDPGILATPVPVDDLDADPAKLDLEPVPGTSRLGAVVKSLLPRLELDAARGLALLSWLEQEPELGKRPPEVVLARLRSVTAAVVGDPALEPSPTRRQPETPVGRARVARRAARPHRAPDRRRQSVDPLEPGTVPREPLATAPVESVPEPEPSARASGRTDFGGLLLLLRVLDELELFERIVNAPILSRRPLRWSLHQLALRLVPLAETDAAALAFAGLGPNAVAPSKEEDPASADEFASIDQMVAAVLDRVVFRLGQQDRPAGQVVHDLCRRQATIEADPGWIDVCLSLAEVSTSARRCGFDLDPGFVPWLGVVVRFVYV